MADASTEEANADFNIERHLVEERHSFSDVAGHENVKSRLMELIVLPIVFPQLFTGGRISFSRNFLIYGPPGVGKTSLALGVSGAHDSVKMYHFAAYDVIKETQRGRNALGAMVRSCESALAQSNVVIVLDDFHMLFTSNLLDDERFHWAYSSIVHILENAGLRRARSSCVLVLMQNPWQDTEGRIRRKCQPRFYLAPPDCGARQQILEASLQPISAKLTADDLVELALITYGLTGKELIEACQTVTLPGKHFTTDLENLKCTFLSMDRSVNTDQYDEFTREYNTPQIDTVHRSKDPETLMLQCCDVIVKCLRFPHDVTITQLLAMALPVPRTLRLLIVRRVTNAR